MALKFQYNKTSLQQLNKELKVRVNALPTLKAKEAALRAEVKRARDQAHMIGLELESKEKQLAMVNRLWPEMPQDLVKVSDVSLEMKKIAGVKTPIFRSVGFAVGDFSLFSSPSWLCSGIEMLKQVATLKIRHEVAGRKVKILEYARRKTTQKVNLYEKVQIPEYKEALLKIKRYLEDEENLAKSSQKILKQRLAAAEAESGEDVA